MLRSRSHEIAWVCLALIACSPSNSETAGDGASQTETEGLRRRNRRDSGSVDSGPPDSGIIDSDVADIAIADSSVIDSGASPDAGPADAGPADAAPADIEAPRATGRYFDIGTPLLQDLWVDPVSGNDANSGASRTSALRTINGAWTRVPRATALTTGYRIQLMTGTYPGSSFPNYMELRRGTYEHPVIIQAADGPHTTVMYGTFNIQTSSYVYLINLDLVRNPAAMGGGGNIVQLASDDHMLIRGCHISGGAQYPQETLKVNQVTNMYVEQSEIDGAFWHALDFMAVEYGHVVDSRFHNSGDTCLLLKGGTAQFTVDGNEVYDCGNVGMLGGQGSGFQFHVTPWLHYEAYDLKFTNNVVHDCRGSGLGAEGALNVLFAYNTLYRVGSRSHGMEMYFGTRQCSGDAAGCLARHNLGGWGPSAVNGVSDPVPNKSVYVFNNLLLNPAPFQSMWAHFAIDGPRIPTAGDNIPSPALADEDLRIRGNVIWNGPPSLPLGFNRGCLATNPTCNETRVRADNAVNSVQPQLVDPAAGNFHPVTGGTAYSVTTYAIPDFPTGPRPSTPLAPTGDLVNRVPLDRDGLPRTTTSPPGAYR